MQRRSPQSRRKRSSQEEGTESVSDVAQQVVLERATPEIPQEIIPQQYPQRIHRQKITSQPPPPTSYRRRENPEAPRQSHHPLFHALPESPQKLVSYSQQYSEQHYRRQLIPRIPAQRAIPYAGGGEGHSSQELIPSQHDSTQAQSPTPPSKSGSLRQSYQQSSPYFAPYMENPEIATPFSQRYPRQQQSRSSAIQTSYHSSEGSSVAFERPYGSAHSNLSMDVAGVYPSGLPVRHAQMHQHDLSRHYEISAGLYLGETREPRRMADSSAISHILPSHSLRRSESECAEGDSSRNVAERSDTFTPLSNQGIRVWEFLRQPPYEPSSFDLLEHQEYQPENPINKVLDPPIEKAESSRSAAERPDTFTPLSSEGIGLREFVPQPTNEPSPHDLLEHQEYQPKPDPPVEEEDFYKSLIRTLHRVTPDYYTYDPPLPIPSKASEGPTSFIKMPTSSVGKDENEQAPSQITISSSRKDRLSGSVIHQIEKSNRLSIDEKESKQKLDRKEAVGSLTEEEIRVGDPSPCRSQEHSPKPRHPGSSLPSIGSSDSSSDRKRAGQAESAKCDTNPKGSKLPFKISEKAGQERDHDPDSLSGDFTAENCDTAGGLTLHQPQSQRLENSSERIQARTAAPPAKRMRPCFSYHSPDPSSCEVTSADYTLAHQILLNIESIQLQQDAKQQAGALLEPTTLDGRTKSELLQNQQPGQQQLEFKYALTPIEAEQLLDQILPHPL
ncbi:hypothetical protein Aperf_G00000070099 [Anoplocephala perfoliata]